ncbi:TrmB family transcriptional regulator [Methanolapillus millepedarum]
MIDQGLIANLKKIGFVENEAKAYAGLVMLQEASARELHELTSIPRAKIYEVLDHLVEKKYVDILQGTPVHYRPIEPDEMIRMIRDDFEKTTDSLLESFDQMELGEFQKDEDAISVWYLRSDWTVRNKIKELFEKTDKSAIIVCQTPKILFDIEDILKAAKEKISFLILVNDVKDYEKLSLVVNKVPSNIVSLYSDLMENTKTKDGCFIFSSNKQILFLQYKEDKLNGFYQENAIVSFIYKTLSYMLSNLDSVDIPENYHPVVSLLKNGPDK